MSILVYKQRFRHPNKKDTPGSNYAHIRYIAIRPRAVKNKDSTKINSISKEKGSINVSKKENYEKIYKELVKEYEQMVGFIISSEYRQSITA